MGVEIVKVGDGVVVNVFVKPGSGQFALRVEDGELVVLCREQPVKGRVNRELIKELSKIFKKRVEIAAGFTSRQKKVLIRDISVDEANSILAEYVSR